MVVTDIYKHTSLIGIGIYYDLKKIYSTGPKVIRLLTFLIY